MSLTGGEPVLLACQSRRLLSGGRQSPAIIRRTATRAREPEKEVCAAAISRYYNLVFIPIVASSSFIKSIGNIASYLAIFVWGATLALVAKCASIPPLHIVGLAGVMLGVAQATKEVRSGGFAALRAPAGACLFEAFGITGYRMLVYPALTMVAPVDAANLVNIWIPTVIVCGLLLAGSRLRARHWLGVACMAAGLAASVADGIGAGHAMALCGGFIFVWYLLKFPDVEGRGGKASAIGNVAAGGFVILLAFIAGNPLAIEGSDWIWFVALLIVSSGNVMLWEYGAKHGDMRAAKVSVLFLPPAAVLWIWVLGVAAPNGPDVFATLAVTAAGLLLSPHVFREARTAH